MSIVTKTGDFKDGRASTGTWGGRRIHKHDIMLEANGTIDELHADIGERLFYLPNNIVGLSFRATLTDIQEQLIKLGGDVSDGAERNYIGINSVDLQGIENLCETLESEVSQKDWIRYGHGTRAAAALDACSKKVRRLERVLAHYAMKYPLRDTCLNYVNRLSDLMHLMARVLDKNP